MNNTLSGTAQFPRESALNHAHAQVTQSLILLAWLMGARAEDPKDCVRARARVRQKKNNCSHGGFASIACLSDHVHTLHGQYCGPYRTTLDFDQVSVSWNDGSAHSSVSSMLGYLAEYASLSC